MKTDDITKELAVSLKSLLDSLNNDIQTKVLELKSSAESNRYYRELLSISNSLEQYKKKEVGLLYVGLLGSYSSGKSSTINSLLDVKGTKDERATGNNPTDDNITLITNESNVENIFTFSKEGVIPIRSKTNFQVDFLENIVLMDTPGSGDPKIIEEIVRDSLPLCDLIIYTLNSTAPFTNIDSPFLIAQQEKLKNIPLIFVLTRGDEFRKTRAHELSDKNFDAAKYEHELQVIINRIAEAIPSSNFKSDDFVIVDNIIGFNIGILKERILAFAKNNTESLVILHNHKLNYFRKEIKFIHNYFLTLSSSKINKCKALIQKAEDNIEYFDDQIDVSKIKLRSLWNENIQVFSGIFGQVESSLQRIVDDLHNIRPFKESSDLLAFRQKVKKKIDEESVFLASRIIRELESKAQSATLDLKEKIIESVDFESLTISMQNFPERANFLFPVEFPYGQEQYTSEALETFKRKAFSDFNSTKDQFITFRKTVQAKRPFDPTSDNLLKYREALRGVMDVYYQALEMYNSAVFSFEVRTQVSELGLATEFDRLEVTGITKTKFNSKTEKELSGNYDEFSNNFVEQIKTIEEKTKLFETDLNKQAPNYSIQEEFDKEKIVAGSYVDNQIDSFMLNIFDGLIVNIQSQLRILRGDISKLKKRRRNKYGSAILLPLILVGFTWLLKKYANVEIPTSIFVNIIIGVLSSLIATLVLSLLDQFEKNKRNKIDEFKKQISTTHNTKADELFNEFKTQNEDRQMEIVNTIRNKWLQTEDTLLKVLDGTQIHIYHTKVMSLKERLTLFVGEYQKSVSQYSKMTLGLFNRDDIYLDKIEEIANTIKNDSIEPSSKLLSKTLDEIEMVQKQIAKIEY